MLRNMWGSSTQQISSDVQHNEELTSYVFRKDQIVRVTNSIHYSRLMPRRKHKNERLEVSLCRSNELTESQVWNICSIHFDAHAPKPAIGRGVGTASSVFAENLAFDPDGKPYPQHANIIGWHDESDKPDSELKHFWIDQAQRMAVNFKYNPRR